MKVLIDNLWISHTTTTVVGNNISGARSRVSLHTDSAAPKVHRRIKAWENKNSAFNWPGKSDPYWNRATQCIRDCTLIICLSHVFVQMYFLHM